MNTHQAEQALRSHNVVIDPGDRKSPLEIVRALGITGIRENVGVQLQQRIEDMPTVEPTE